MIQKHKPGLLGSGAMKRFDYFFGVVLAQKLLQRTDNLSKTLQNPSLLSLEAQCVADLTVRTLSSIRSDEAFWLFWQSLMIRLKEVNVDEPQLPRRRKVPARFEIGTSEGSHPSTPEDMYRQQYFDCLDCIVKCIKTSLTRLVLQC